MLLKLSHQENSKPDGFTGEFHETVKKSNNLTQTISDNREGKTSQLIFFVASITLIPKPDKDIAKEEKTTNQYHS